MKKEATGLDQAVGFGLVGLAGVIFAYYTLWIVILPFVEPGHLIHQYFLPKVYAIVIPVAAGLVVLLGLGASIGAILLKSKKPKEKAS